MTIDELDIKTINIDEAAELLFTTGEFENKDEAKNAVNSAVETIKELQWYRSQDFIRREDATKIFAEHIELTTDMDEGQAMFVAEHQYRIIPKAEYRGKDNE